MKMKRVVKMPLRRTPPSRLSPSSLRARAAIADEVYEEEDYDGSGEPSMKFMHALLVVLLLHVIAVVAICVFASIKTRQTAETKSVKPTASETAAAPDENLNPSPAAVHNAAPPAPVTTTVEKPKAAETKPAAAPPGKTYTVKAGDTLTHIAALEGVTVEALQKENGLTYSIMHVGQILKIPGAAKETKTSPATKPEPAATKTATGGTISTVPKPSNTSPSTPAIKPIAAVASAPVAKPAPEAAAPADPVKPAPPASSKDVYVVAKGDNPTSIAKKLHVSYSALLSINDIKDPTKIQIGQKLKLPAKKN